MSKPVVQVFDRLIQLTRWLRASQGLTVMELASRFEVSVRSVQRDLRRLEQIGVPLEDLGRGKGYRIRPDYLLRGQGLDAQEAFILGIGAQFAQSQIGALAGSKSQSALAKVLPAAEIGKVERVRELVAMREAEPGSSLEIVQQALTQRRVLQFEHSSPGKAQVVRRLEPWSLTYQGEHWYLHGFDLDRQDQRTFRLSRIAQAALGPLCQGRRPDAEAQQFLFHHWDFGTSEPQRVEIRLAPDQLAWFRENPVHPGQEVKDELLIVSVRNVSNFLHWAAGVDGLEVLRPQSIRNAMRSWAEAVLLRHSEKSPDGV